MYENKIQIVNFDGLELIINIEEIKDKKFIDIETA